MIQSKKKKLIVTVPFSPFGQKRIDAFGLGEQGNPDNSNTIDGIVADLEAAREHLVGLRRESAFEILDPIERQFDT